jgi:glycosyltransferase involved in cell wall biosynthesis
MNGHGRAPTVSAVIPAHNAAQYLPDAIESVLSQTSPVGECIVVDDGSTDGTAAAARAFEGEVRLIEQHNAGPAAARNRGVSASSGDFLAFLDADDRWLPERIERQVAALAQDPRFAAVVCAMQVVDGSMRPVGVIQQRPDVSVEDMLTWRTMLCPTPSSLLIERRCFEAIGGFDERIFGSEDWLLTFRLVARRALTAIPDPLVQYRIHETNISSSAERLEREMLRAYQAVFSDSRAPPEVRRLRRKAYANLHRVIAGAYFAEGNLTAFAREALVSLATHPSTLPYFLATPVRRLRRGRVARDPFAMARAESRRTSGR